MKVLVMGAGGVGGFYGGILNRSGHDVTIVARGQHLESISHTGLRVESRNFGNFTVHPKTTSKPAEDQTADLVLFCVKGYDNAEAISLITPAVGPNSTILTLQNGIGSGDQLAKAFGSENILLGATYIDGDKREPGLVTETGDSPRIVFGEPDGHISKRSEQIHEAFSTAGVPVELSDDVTKALWEKLVYITAWSGMICITRTFFPQILDTPEAAMMTRSVLEETFSVGKAKQVSLEKDIVENTLDVFRKVEGTPVSSMFSDLQKGGRLEVSVLNGAVSRIGKEVGVNTPTNDFITACLLVAHNRALDSHS